MNSEPLTAGNIDVQAAVPDPAKVKRFAAEIRLRMKRGHSLTASDAALKIAYGFGTGCKFDDLDALDAALWKVLIAEAQP